MAALTMIRPLDTSTGPRQKGAELSYVTTNICGYPENLEAIRLQEYPTINDTTYLDHAGTTLYPRSMIESYTQELTKSLFGNPHSASASSLLSSRRIDDIRLKVLRFIQADPDYFDVVFVSNATAAVKLVADAFRDHPAGFWYGYHSDSHTSLVGVRELAQLGSRCFQDDTDVESWISGLGSDADCQKQLTLFAYPGQSNMTGRYLPWEWSNQVRRAVAVEHHDVYTLLDAAALASTTALDFSHSENAPDFTALSFYKIFGFPDLGALIVRKASSNIMRGRRYFAGGTVDAVAACDDSLWHNKKEVLHSALEDGTLPFHNIIALDHALETHTKLYGSMHNVSSHTRALCSKLYDRLSTLQHWNGRPVCKIYRHKHSAHAAYGPVIAFNLLDSCGSYVSNSEVEKLAIVSNIQMRTGGLCNPGGIAKHLNLTTEDMKKHYAAGLRCGGENDIMHGKPTGVIRVSLGAMSSSSDINKFIGFLEEFYVSHKTLRCAFKSSVRTPKFRIESIAIFPIKSCSAFNVPHGISWEVGSRGFAWDREWCLIHRGTNMALNQKRYPKMALLEPTIDLTKRQMTISIHDNEQRKSIAIGLDELPPSASSLIVCEQFKRSQSIVCGENVPVCIYTASEISDFFSEVLEVPCTLARYHNDKTSKRKAKLRQPLSVMPKTKDTSSVSPSIKLSNESPILLISRSSVNRLNEQIQEQRSHTHEITAESFRANIVIAEQATDEHSESPYAEDFWQRLSIGSGNLTSDFTMLGPCQRCQMVCVDQSNAKRRREPFSTLAKTRRWDGGVWFGVHMCLSTNDEEFKTTLRVGDAVTPS